MRGQSKKFGANKVRQSHDWKLLAVVSALTKMLEDVEPACSQGCACCGKPWKRQSTCLKKKRRIGLEKIYRLMGKEAAREFVRERKAKYGLGKLTKARRAAFAKDPSAGKKWLEHNRGIRRRIMQELQAACPPYFVTHTYKAKKIKLQFDVGGRPIVVLVCSEVCREQAMSGNKEYDECLVQLHDQWQQVKAIKGFLRNPSRDAFSLLSPELRPALSSQDSCRR